jgi:hypothetical protein
MGSSKPRRRRSVEKITVEAGLNRHSGRLPVARPAGPEITEPSGVTFGFIPVVTDVTTLVVVTYPRTLHASPCTTVVLPVGGR